MYSYKRASFGFLLVAVLAPTLLVGVDSLVLPTQQGRQHCRSQTQHALDSTTKFQYKNSLPTWRSQQHRRSIKKNRFDSLALHSSTESASGADDDATIADALEIPNGSSPVVTETRKLERLRKSLPFQNDDLDSLILKTCIPTVLNLMVVPLVNSVDTFWVGRLGLAMALAAQSAANQACFTLFFIIAFLPNMTAPLVASAVSSGDNEQARERVCESLFLCNLLGAIGTFALMVYPRQILTALLLPAGSPVLDYAAPYLRWRALGMVPSKVIKDTNNIFHEFIELRN